MKNNNYHEMFTPGTEIQVIIYKDANVHLVEELSLSLRNLIKEKPIINSRPGIPFRVKLSDILVEAIPNTDKYNIIGKGVVI